MIHVLHTDSFVSYYPRYQINKMKAKLSENSLFGDSDRGEIRGGGGRRYRKAAPNKSQKYLNTDGQRRPEFANFFFLPPTLSTYLINLSM